jgi:hypothetical protein
MNADDFFKLYKAWLEGVSNGEQGQA